MLQSGSGSAPGTRIRRDSARFSTIAWQRKTITAFWPNFHAFHIRCRLSLASSKSPKGTVLGVRVATTNRLRAQASAGTV